MRRRHWLAMLMLLCAAAAGADTAKFLTAGTRAGQTRYLVTVETSGVEDVHARMADLLASCACENVPDLDVDPGAFVITASPEAAETLSRDTRVRLVVEIAPEGEVRAPERRAAEARAVPAAGVTLQPETNTMPYWSVSYAYDKSGNVKQAGSDKFTYDSLGRLIYGDAGTGYNAQHTYDRYGNLRTLTYVTPDKTTVIETGADGATNRIGGAGANIVATYDNAGRLVTSTAGKFEYDGSDSVVASTVNGLRRIHLYTAGDERVATLVMDGGGQEMSSEWTLRDPSGKVLRRFAKSAGTWAWVEDYVYRDGQLLAAEVNTAAGTLHFHLDHLGTPRLITGNGGVKVESHTYFPFGAETTAPLPNEEKLKFTGHERDAASLDYMHARYYNAEWGRFLSVDPILGESHNPQSWNRYAYARNNPLALIDPTGMEPCTVTDADVNGGEPFESDCTTVTASEPSRTELAESYVSPEAWGHSLAWLADGGGLFIATPMMNMLQGLKNDDPAQFARGALPTVLLGAGLGVQSGLRTQLGTTTASIRFGDTPNQVSHSLRHLQAKGMDANQVMAAIRSDLSGVPLPAGPHNGLVVINGVQVRYTAYRFLDGTINVGRITPPR